MVSEVDPICALQAFVARSCDKIGLIARQGWWPHSRVRSVWWSGAPWTNVPIWRN
jgi:hypothetical protein